MLPPTRFKSTEPDDRLRLMRSRGLQCLGPLKLKF